MIRSGYASERKEYPTAPETIWRTRKGTQRTLTIDPFKVWRGVVDCDSGDIEVWFPLSSSNEGLEKEPGEVLGTRETSRTALSTASFWLASETDLEQSRTKSVLASWRTIAASPQVTSGDEHLETSISEGGFKPFGG